MDTVLEKPGESFAVESPGLLLKARPHTEGDRRYIYCEPSNENWDAERERVLQKALAASAEHFLKFGNLDIQHRTLPSVAKALDLPKDPSLYEIGIPREVKTEPVVLVKGEIYRGEGPIVEEANLFWQSLTEQDPPRRWYPSVGGRTLAKSCDAKGCVITKVVWTNIGFWREPVNHTVKAVTTVPFGAFAKALLSGYGTDAANFTQGRALQRESIEGSRRRDYRRAAARLLKTLGTAACLHTVGSPTLAKIIAHFRDCEGMSQEEAEMCARQLQRDVAARVNRAAAMAA